MSILICFKFKSVATSKIDYYKPRDILVCHTLQKFQLKLLKSLFFWKAIEIILLCMYKYATNCTAMINIIQQTNNQLCLYICKWSFLFIHFWMCNRNLVCRSSNPIFFYYYIIIILYSISFYIYFVPPLLKGKYKHEFFIFQIFFIIHVEQTPINSKTNAHINEGHFTVCPL